MNPKMINRDRVDSLVDPLTVISNGMELLKQRFKSTMDSYAIEEFERIERSIEKINREVEKIRDNSLSE